MPRIQLCARLFLTVAVFLLAPPLGANPALADGEEGVPSREMRRSSNSLEAEAQTDHRLPPVFPGEEIRDGKNVIKSWSTSGAVAVGRPPEPFRDEKQIPNLSSGGGIIIDGRRDLPGRN